jgi:hypothetical protein
MEAGSEHSTRRVNVATCVQCGCHSGLRWTGWRAYRVNDPEYGEAPALAFFCRACAAAAFDHGEGA